MLCPKCGGRMKIMAFLTDFSVVDRIISHLKQKNNFLSIIYGALGGDRLWLIVGEAGMLSASGFYTWRGRFFASPLAILPGLHV